MSSYKLRPFIPDDLGRIEHSLGRLYQLPPEICRRHFHWKLFENPYADSPLIVVAESGGIPVGRYHYTPMRWRNSLDGSEQVILAPGGAFVLPEHRGSGLLGRMMAFGREWLKPDYRWFLNTTSTPNSVGAYRRFGAVPIAGRFFLDACSPRGLVHYCLNYRKDNPTRARQGEYDDILVTGEIMEKALCRIAGGRVLAREAVELKRDEVFYGWRFRNPGRTYTFYYAGYPGEITGFVIVSHSRNNLRGYIVDYGQSDDSSLRRILGLIRKQRHFDILSIYEFCVDEDLSGALSAGGLGKNPAVRRLERKVSPFCPLFLIRTGTGEEDWKWSGLDLRDIANWSIMGAIRELD